MAIWNDGEKAVLAELGLRLTQARLGRNFTQAQLADAAAVSKRTVERLETGQSVQLSNLVRVLDALDLTRNLELLVPAAGPRPMELLRNRGKRRQRASRSKTDPGRPWAWNDDKS